MVENRPFYSIDTSALIDWWEDYSPDVFPGLLPLMENLIIEGRLRAVRYVRDEITDSGRPNDELTLAKWCKAQNGFYLDDNEEVQIMVRKIMRQFQNPKKSRGIGNADPFVIAQAAVSGDNWCVVSSERAANGNADRNPNIPFVCKELQVRPIRFLDMLRMENWKLG